MISNIHHLCKSLLIPAAIFAGTFLNACSDENFGGDPAEIDHGNGLAIQAICSEMLPNYIDPETVMSRASDPKTEAERVINTLHIFFFDQNGKFLENRYTNFCPYQKISGNIKVIKTGDGNTDVFTQMEGVTIVAIANIDASDATGNPDSDPDMFFTKWTEWGKIESGSRDTGNTYEITDLDKLKAWIYSPKLRTDEGRDLSQLPEAGMPMIGILENQTIKEHDGIKNLIIPMTAMMARVDISVKLEPNQESRDGQLPTMTITGYGVKNMPVTVPFTSRTGADEEHCTVAEVYKDEQGSTELEVTAGLPITINKDSEAVKFTYYTYENIQLPDYAAKRPDGTSAFDGNKNLMFPQGVDTNAEKQRWKPTIAKKERASALILKGSYTTHQGLTYQAQFTVYMGADPISDFMVQRNHQYSNNITIHGLDYVRNTEDNVYTFDGRVNVVTDNPLYLAIVNERKVDAHASALPMDVWLLLREAAEGGGSVEHNWNSTVKVSLKNPQTGESPDWIRMKMIPRAEMEATNFAAGTGIEPYFTDNMFQKEGMTDEVIIDGNKDKSRSRVYFYIDENVPSTNTNTDVPDRYATVYITYENNKDGKVDRRERTLEIEQRGMLKIYDNTNSDRIVDAWIEYYEEYLEHNDPLDQHTAPGEFYTGLPWGKNIGYFDISGVRGDGTGLYARYDIYCKGLDMTQGVMNSSSSDVSSIKTVQLYNETRPESAFHYCYGKNKRNSDGTVSTSKAAYWYMPGITELERALTKYYLTFSDFQGNFYWSAAPGKQRSNWGVVSEQTSHARATKVIIINGTPDYAGSGYDAPYYTDNNGTSGRAPRETPLRIRAFYKFK